MSKNEAEMVLLYRAADSMEASMLEGVLEEHGVPVKHVGGQGALAFGELGAGALLVDLYVPRTFQAQSIDLVNRYFEEARTKRKLT